MKTFEKKQARFLIHTHTKKKNKILFRQSMNIDELFVANQKEGNEYLTTCFDEQTSFTRKSMLLHLLKWPYFFYQMLQTVPFICKNYYICCGQYKVKTVNIHDCIIIIHVHYVFILRMKFIYS